MSPVGLSKLLSGLPKTADPNLLVGFETGDDAGVYRLDADTALVHTADVITPPVDDPASDKTRRPSARGASWADLMRRAVSKKKKEDLLKHKQIFIDQGPANGVDADTAGKIFEEIETFANYGFNKSDGADYAVIGDLKKILPAVIDEVKKAQA